MKKLFVFILCVAISGTVCSQSKKELKAQIGNLSKEIELKDIEINKLQKDNKDLKTQELDLKRQIERLKGKELRIKSLVKDSINSSKIIKEQEKLLASYSEQLNRLDSAVTTLNNLVANLASQQKETSRRNVEKNNGTSRQKAVRDSIARVKFQTPDLKMVGAHGPVKSIVYDEGTDPVFGLCGENYFNRGDSFYFDTNGNMEYPGYERNNKGEIKGWSGSAIGECDYEYEYGQSFSYGTDGYVSRISGSGFEYHYNAKTTWDKTGKLTKLKVDIQGDGLSYTDKYRYLKTDKYGNWTEAERTESYIDWDDSNKTTKNKISRTIEYYD